MTPTSKHATPLSSIFRPSHNFIELSKSLHNLMLKSINAKVLTLLPIKLVKKFKPFPTYLRTKYFVNANVNLVMMLKYVLI